MKQFEKLLRIQHRLGAMQDREIPRPHAGINIKWHVRDVLYWGGMGSKIAAGRGNEEDYVGP